MITDSQYNYFVWARAHPKEAQALLRKTNEPALPAFKRVSKPAHDWLVANHQGIGTQWVLLPTDRAEAQAWARKRVNGEAAAAEKSGDPLDQFSTHIHVTNAKPLPAIDLKGDGLFKWVARPVNRPIGVEGASRVWSSLTPGELIKSKHQRWADDDELLSSMETLMDETLERLKSSGKLPDWVPSRRSAVYATYAQHTALWGRKLRGVTQSLVAVEETGNPEHVAVADAKDMEDVVRALQDHDHKAASARAEQYWLRYWDGHAYRKHPTDDPDCAVEVLLPETARVLGAVENPPAPRPSKEQLEKR